MGKSGVREGGSGGPAELVGGGWDMSHEMTERRKEKARQGLIHGCYLNAYLGQPRFGHIGITVKNRVGVGV